MYINNFKNWLVARLRPANTFFVDAQEYADIKLRVVGLERENKQLRMDVYQLNSQAVEATPMVKEHLTMKQLGSYIPSFEAMSTKTDAFKTVLAQLCYQLSISPEWKYLVEHLKQDQVNLYLFTEDRKSEDFMRGSINGIYVVDEQVRLLGSGYKTPEPPQTQSEK